MPVAVIPQKASAAALSSLTSEGGIPIVVKAPEGVSRLPTPFPTQLGTTEAAGSTIEERRP